MTHELTSIVTDHGIALLIAGSVVLLVMLIALAALIVFTRWVVHTEVGRLTTALHEEMRGIRAKLDVMHGRRWTDQTLDSEFNDLRSILRLHDGEIHTLHQDHIRFHGPQIHTP